MLVLDLINGIIYIETQGMGSNTEFIVHKKLIKRIIKQKDNSTDAIY